MGIQYTDNILVLSNVGGTTTSSAYDISKRQQITVEFNVNNDGTTTFTIDMSNDGVNWITGVAFLDAQGTAASTYVTSKVVTAAAPNQGAIVTPGFRFIRVVATTNGGTASATLQTAG